MHQRDATRLADVTSTMQTIVARGEQKAVRLIIAHFMLCKNELTHICAITWLV